MRRILPSLVVLPAFLARPEPPPPVPMVSAAVAVELPIRRVDIGVPTLTGGFRWEPEAMGSVLAALEAQLVLVEGLIPSIGTAGPPVSLSEAPNEDDDTWLGAIETSGTANEWEVRLTLCQPYSPCEPLTVTGRTDQTWEIAQDLALHVTEAIARPPPDMEPLRLPADRYGALISGRGAAQFYGVLPPPEPNEIGNRRRDSVERAVFMDATIPLSWWLLGRHRLKHGMYDGAITALRQAQDVGTARSDLAMALAAAGRWHDARDAWGKGVAEPRFALAAAAVALQAEDTVSAQAWLSLLPEREDRDPDLLRLLVKQAGDDVTDDLLIEWSQAAPEDPRPVEGHIRWLVHRERYREARNLTEELARRGAVETAEALDYALSVELGDQVPDAAPVASGLQERLQLASVAAASGDTRLALRTVRAILARDPYNTEALALLVDLSLASGDNAEARRAHAVLMLADPTWGKERLPWR